MVGRERGFVAIEWVAAVTLLLLPAVVLVGSLPAWVERKHAATIAAQEAVRQLQRDWPDADPSRAELVAQYAAADHGVPAGDIRMRVIDASGGPGGQIQVEVRVRMPAIAVISPPSANANAASNANSNSNASAASA
jgi:hypothetical protein